MKNKLILVVLLMAYISVNGIFAQDLAEMLENEMSDNETILTSATFKATRILNGHSIERMPTGQLDFRIHHRFGRINAGAYELWGLDQANTHFSLEYGITDWLMLGLGRGTYEKTFDGFAKFSILRQATGHRPMPVSISFLTGQYLNSLRWENEEISYNFWHRFEFANQLLIARKFNRDFSFQIMPTFLHRNLVKSELDPNDIFSVGAGARVKLTSRVSVNAEYYYSFKPDNRFLSVPLYNPLSIGFDIETGGHVFQLLFSNSLSMTEHGMIGNTTGSWLNGDIHFGFNISRVFNLKK